MSFFTPSASTVVLNQQQQQIQSSNQNDEETTGDRCKNLSQRCTIVENGRVVVKPLR